MNSVFYVDTAQHSNFTQEPAFTFHGPPNMC